MNRRLFVFASASLALFPLAGSAQAGNIERELVNVRAYFASRKGRVLLEAQALLKSSGHYKGTADGKWGNGTERAFRGLLKTYIVIGGSGSDWGINKPDDTRRLLDWVAEAEFSVTNGLEFPD